MAKQTFTTGQVLTADQMTSLQQTAMLGGSASAKVASYTLVAADAGTTVSMSNASATTITVNTGLFAAGDTVTILNVGAGTCTITAGTATVSKPANATLALVTSAGGVLYFTATGAATFMPFDVGAAASGGWTLISTTTLGAADVTLSSIPGTYKHLALIGVDCYGTNATYTELYFNNWTSGDYYYQQFENSSSTVTQTHGANSGSAGFFIGFSTSANHQTTPFYIYNYASSTLYKQYTGGSNGIDSGGLRWGRFYTGGEWRKTNAITELNLKRSSTQTNVGTVQLWGIS